MKTVAYLRVSTPQQDASSQRLAILEYARKHDLHIDDFIEATASGQASEKRRRLDELTNALQPGDRLVVSELYRLGRSLGQVVAVGRRCAGRQVAGRRAPSPRPALARGDVHRGATGDLWRKGPCGPARPVWTWLSRTTVHLARGEQLRSLSLETSGSSSSAHGRLQIGHTDHVTPEIPPECRTAMLLMSATSANWASCDTSIA